MIPTTVKAGIAAALALGSRVAHRAIRCCRPTPPAFIAALLAQVLVGVTLGMFTMLLVNTLQAAGSFVDLFAGFSLSQIYDPLERHAVGGVRSLLPTPRHHAAVHDRRVPHPRERLLPLVRRDPGRRALDRRRSRRCSRTTWASSSSPRSRSRARCSACLFLAEITLGLLARAAPNLNVFSLAFPLRVIIALIVVAIAIPVVAPALGNLVRDAVAPLGH